MNTTDLTYLLQHPQTLDDKQTNEIKSIINEFPYFQSVRAIYLKGLKNEDSFKYNQELKTTAAHTADRSILFDFITSEEFIQNKVSEYIKQNLEHIKDIEVKDVEDISINKSVIIDDTLKQYIKDTEPTLNPSLFKAKHITTDTFTADSTETTKTPKEILEVGKPLNFNKNEAHSFGEWLKITSFKPIIRDKKKQIKNDLTEVKKTNKFDLIDKFIANNPKIEPVKKEGKSHNIAKAQMMKPKSLMTETLARIYVEQKNYDKAIQSYKILSLKYPEKSSFFADQIQAVKELQKHNTI
ncbi:hypothetical protein D7030_14400 [Flavobacteriaceae bacterium AU392]|nr:hypothetical protein D1817_04090 [Flavobacteriaceae bacterium]RKM81491.1 hypothetical protein D7030_14400 [Flavobacteriaceae bacterium AU392]